MISERERACRHECAHLVILLLRDPRATYEPVFGPECSARLVYELSDPNNDLNRYLIALAGIIWERCIEESADPAVLLDDTSTDGLVCKRLARELGLSPEEVVCSQMYLYESLQNSRRAIQDLAMMWYRKWNSAHPVAVGV